MAFREKDYLRRLLDRLAPILAKVLGLKAAGRIDEALAELEQGSGTVFGVGYRTLGLVDAASAALLLRDPEMVRAYAETQLAEAELHEARGDGEAAASLRRRARELDLEARRGSPGGF